MSTSSTTDSLSRVDLLSATPDKAATTLDQHFHARGQPPYRTRQVLDWLYAFDAVDFRGMTNLPASEREALTERFTWVEPDAATIQKSSDGTAKHLWRLADGELVESVLIPSGSRLTLCLSSQVGCAIGCTFCATGWAGFSRQLSAGEIAGQFRASGRWAQSESMGSITNVVYMGMGEPLANAKAVNRSLTILNAGFGLGARRITVSTVGLVPGIRMLAARKEQFELALSLHAPTSALRSTLIPLEKRYPLPEVMEAVDAFRRTKGRRVTFEYTMIHGINDGEELIDPLVTLARRVEAFVNLIPFNPIPYQDWQPSRPERIDRFRTGLEEAGLSVAVREPRGRDIDAACGQLRADALVQIGARDL